MKRIVPLIGFLLVIGAVFWPALVAPTGMMIYGDDIHRQYYFYREFFNYWIGHGVFPWWNPNLFGGEPFIANPVVNIWYAPTWLFVFLPLERAYPWHMYLHIVWAALGMYMLLRRVLGQKVGRIAPWIAGLTFALSGFFMARTYAGHVDVIAAASWMPWVVWGIFTLLERAEVDVSLISSHQGPGHKSSHSRFSVKAMMRLEMKRLPAKNIVLASILFALQLYAGYQTMAFFTVIIVSIMAVVWSVGKRSVLPLLYVGVSLFLGVCLAALQLIPEQEVFRLGIRTYNLPYQWISYGAITWQSLVQLLSPFFFGNQHTYAGPPPNFIEHSMFVGISGIVLALIGCIAVLKRRYILLVTAMGVVVMFGVWVALASNAGFDVQKLLWNIVPMYHYLRIPARHLVLVVFGLSALVGVGVSVLNVKNTLVKALLLTLIVLELVMFGKSFIELKAVPRARHDHAMIGLFVQDQQPYRTLQNFGVWLPERDAFDFDAAMIYNVHSATGYDPSILRSYYEYIARASGSVGQETITKQDVQVPYVSQISADAIDRLNIKYLVVPTQYDGFSGSKRYTPIYEKGSVRVYENTTVKPRFYLEKSSCGTVHVVQYTPNEVQLDVDSTCDTNLLSSEVHYPGWEVFVDGKKSDISVSEGVFRIVFVPSGKHTVIYQYNPRIFVLGALISLITAVGCGIWIGKRKND
jgi:hypothetical protein